MNLHQPTKIKIIRDSVLIQEEYVKEESEEDLTLFARKTCSRLVGSIPDPVHDTKTKSVSCPVCKIYNNLAISILSNIVLLSNYFQPNHHFKDDWWKEVIALTINTTFFCISFDLFLNTTEIYKLHSTKSHLFAVSVSIHKRLKPCWFTTYHNLPI